MGIKGLGQIIRKHCLQNGLFQMVPLSRFENCRIAIDATGWLCEIMAAANSSVVESTNLRQGEIDKNLVDHTFFKIITYKLITAMNLKIKYVFIFDGEPLPDKALTRASRIENRLDTIGQANQLMAKMETEENADEENDEEETRAKTLLKQTWNLQDRHVSLFRRLLTALGIPQVQAAHDAEEAAAWLNAAGYCQACQSSDGDTLAFGGKLIIRWWGEPKVYDESGRHVPSCEVWQRDLILQALGLNEQQLIDFCLMSGCDFNLPVDGLSARACLELIRRFGSIEALPRLNCQGDFLNPRAPDGRSVVSRLPKNKYYNLAMLNYQRCRQIFALKPVNEVILACDLTVKPYNMDEIITFYSEFNLQSLINSLINARNLVENSDLGRNLLISGQFRHSAGSSSSQTLGQLQLPAGTYSAV